MHCFSYPISPITTTDLNMLPLFYGYCINKFVVMQAKYSPLFWFHLLHLHPRSSAHHTLVNDDTSQMVHNLMYIPDQGSGQRKARYPLQPELDSTWPPGRIFFIQAQPDMWLVRLNLIFMYNFQVGPVFLGGILGKKSRSLSNLLFIAGRKFLSKLGQHIGWTGVFRSCRVRFIGLDGS